jgi:hypothetical protein
MPLDAAAVRLGCGLYGGPSLPVATLRCALTAFRPRLGLDEEEMELWRKLGDDEVRKVA